MTAVDYKILFEVRILHDYYLFGPDPLEKKAGGKDKIEKSFFAMNTAAQAARLQELLRGGRYDIRQDLDFVIGSNEITTFSDLRLKMTKTATGFYVGMEVKSILSNGGSVRFRPAISPPDDTTLTFGIALSNPSFGAISNLRLDKDSRNIYYFTNNGRHDGLSLSRPISRLTPGQEYRMGDLALVGQVLCQAVADNTGTASSWEPVSGNAFVNQTDRSLGIDEKWYRDWLSTLQRPAVPLMGVIQIALKNGNNDLSPVGDDGLLATRYLPGQARPVHPVFELRFLSMATYWRYRKMDGFSDEEIKAIEKDAGKLLNLVGADFVTKTPWHLARELPPFPLDAASALGRIPNAQPGSIKTGGGKLFSDVYFNSINPVYVKKQS
jgi:hypothetical protein